MQQGFVTGSIIKVTHGFLCSLLPRLRPLPIRLSLQQFFFRDAEHSADGIVELFGFCVSGHCGRWQWLQPTDREWRRRSIYTVAAITRAISRLFRCFWLDAKSNASALYLEGSLNAKPSLA